MSARFFVETPLTPGSTIALPAAAAHHAVRVLRLAQGEPITLFDGRGGEHAATIARIERDRVTASVERFQAIEREPPRAVTLVQSILAADAMDWAVRKAVELGAAAIAPVIAARSNAPGGSRAERRLAHWRSIAIAACEQCGRNRIPPIAQSQPLLQWLDACNGREPAAMLAPGAAHSLAALARERDLRYVVVGPEGGFTESELALADRHGIARAHLGSRTLRSETAAAAALATIEAVAGEPA